MKKRQLIYIPEINPNTFLLFFSRGDSGRSFSFRDYSQGTITLTRARDYSYRYTDDEILDKAKWKFDAPTHHTEDKHFWQAEVETLNRKYLISQ